MTPFWFLALAVCYGGGDARECVSYHADGMTSRAQCIEVAAEAARAFRKGGARGTWPECKSLDAMMLHVVEAHRMEGQP